ncbi:MAG TPA: helix-turn-helix domain-containing protein [Balneolaceae bacterium]|nr:helix-turn-helix domain-containing protein [Balneolaceae bacterium]
MKKISLLVYEDAVLSAISGPLDILITTNQFLKEMGGQAAFQLELVSEKLKNIQLHQPAQFICHKTLPEVEETDLVIAPAFNGEANVVLEKNRALVEWIKTMHGRGAEIASLCFGSYFLGEAGLLAGKSCTSHWMTVDNMQQKYPEAKVLPDVVITDQEGIYTSGGAFSSLNLILYLVEKFCGREVGIQISKTFSIDMDRVSQAHFAVFQGQRGHEDEEIIKAQTFIEQNYHDEISVEQVAEQSHMSKRNFIRRFKKATQNTPLQYLQRVKVEAAKKSLEKGGQSISSLMYDVGYNDAKTFRTVFKRITGLTPQDYRSKYSRN